MDKLQFAVAGVTGIANLTISTVGDDILIEVADIGAVRLADVSYTLGPGDFVFT